LGAGELVTRVLYAKSQFNRARMRPKPSAFDPTPYTELSVVHITGLANVTVWGLAKKTLGNQPGRDKIHARADLPVKELLEQNLRAILDDNPFKRHTSVVGWPDIAEANERKARWKEICLALSESPDVTLVIPSTPIPRI
jgi:hypothetical protein